MQLHKSCPHCSISYSDISLNYCLEDGSLLSAPLEADQSEIETVVRAPRVFEVNRKTNDQVTVKSDGRIAIIIEPVILITVNRLYKPDISAELLYEITRGVWKVSERREKAKYAFSVYKGIIREAYEIFSWHPAPGGDSEMRKQWISDKGIEVGEIKHLRWQFDGAVSKELQHYVGCSTKNYQKQGAQNPIKYVNC